MSFVERTPQSCLAFKSLDKCRVIGDPALRAVPVKKFVALGVPENDFSKRSVSQWRKRNVASAYGLYPKNVLSGTFKKLRRTASTEKSKRMSERFARTFNRHRLALLEATMPSPEMSSTKSSWRPLHSVVSRVLRNVRIPAVPASPRPTAASNG